MSAISANACNAERTINPAVAKLDFSTVHRKLMDDGEGLGWTLEQCNDADRDYRRFLSLLLEYPSLKLVPTTIIDSFWHFHILDTRKYFADTYSLFGSYLHHDPNMGLEGIEDKKRLAQAFELTKSLYEARFGVSMGNDLQRCGGNCRSCGGRVGEEALQSASRSN
ncbi:glycine-rich domain-containing protein [Solimonas sp. K1W22B-7]|uniref:glycine-rich domain-containing protein n=1 Tax=Solimonas sp. K1W22B-7 TaxID=2303331 RepID=UPI0013C4ACE5|nr:hypothetical protein [Solimonas sp. K1W22B-7]